MVFSPFNVYQVISQNEVLLYFDKECSKDHANHDKVLFLNIIE